VKVKANGIEQYCTVEGSGPWVVLSHSLCCDLRMWDSQAELLAKKFSVLRYDTRGHGRSDAPAGEYTLEMLAEDARCLLDAMGIAACHWIGLSMGGMIGQVFALRYPQMVKSLILADTTSRYPAEAKSLWEGRIATATGKGIEPLVEGTLSRWFTDAFRAQHPEVCDPVAAMIRATPVPGFIGCCHAIPRINLTQRLKEIACPAMVIVGEQDAGTPVAMAQEIHAALPGSELVIIPSAAHLSNLEQPAAFNKAISGFLDKHA